MQFTETVPADLFYGNADQRVQAINAARWK
jgi:hypothetical protein